ncbi:DNA sulfur modification protein DndB [Agromyces sp. NPDC058104]|uniref:DNA sulfur modification protein DndB n=1 Tax=Agromyces sp. NPDC058104 TaxID=3346342 RepID=UPI0036D8159F
MHDIHNRRRDTSMAEAGIVIPEVPGNDSRPRFAATRFRQGGRTVYSLDLSLESVIASIMPPDPDKPTEGNRAIRPKHALEFGQYIRQHEDWVVPGLIMRAPDIFDFEVLTEVEGTTFGILRYPLRSLMDINILDGQHRILGINMAMKSLADDIDKAQNHLAAARRQDPGGRAEEDARATIAKLKKRMATLANDHVALQIFIEDDPMAYRQMFFDIADNQLGITASVRSRFDSRKVVNRAYPLVNDHPLLVGRLDLEGDRLGRGSPFLLGAKHVVEIIRCVTVGLDGRVSKIQEVTLKERDIADNARAFLDRAVDAFPDLQAVQNGTLSPDELRRSSLLGSVLMLRILAAVGHDLMTGSTEKAIGHDLPEGAHWQPAEVEAFYALLAPHMEGPVYPGSIWLDYMPGFWDDGTYSPRSRRQDLRGVKDTLVKWAIERPEFLVAAPKPRPIDEDIEIEEHAPLERDSMTYRLLTQ